MIKLIILIVSTLNKTACDCTCLNVNKLMKFCWYILFYVINRDEKYFLFNSNQ
jgi:hypothetical protein